jgi:hypothetical protein
LLANRRIENKEIVLTKKKVCYRWNMKRGTVFRGELNLKRCEVDFPDTRMKGITLGRQLTPRGRRDLRELPYALQPLFSRFDTMMNDRANGADLFLL